MAEIEIVVGAVQGLEKGAVHAFENLAAETPVKIEVGPDELSTTVPAGKVWTGKVVLYIREDDA